MHDINRKVSNVQPFFLSTRREILEIKLPGRVEFESSWKRCRLRQYGPVVSREVCSLLFDCVRRTHQGGKDGMIALPEHQPKAWGVLLGLLRANVWVLKNSIPRGKGRGIHTVLYWYYHRALMPYSPRAVWDSRGRHRINQLMSHRNQGNSGLCKWTYAQHGANATLTEWLHCGAMNLFTATENSAQDVAHSRVRYSPASCLWVLS